MKSIEEICVQVSDTKETDQQGLTPLQLAAVMCNKGLAVGVESAKLKSIDIIFAHNDNDVMHAVTFLTLLGAPLRTQPVHIVISAPAHCQLYFLRTCKLVALFKYFK